MKTIMEYVMTMIMEDGIAAIKGWDGNNGLQKDGMAMIVEGWGGDDQSQRALIEKGQDHYNQLWRDGMTAISE